MFRHPAWAVGSCSSGYQLPKLSELSQLEVLTILMGHSVNAAQDQEAPEFGSQNF